MYDVTSGPIIRVSTSEQSLDLQVDALENANCNHIFQEKMSGATSDRPKLEEALKFMREGDTHKALITKGYQGFIGIYE